MIGRTIFHYRILAKLGEDGEEMFYVEGDISDNGLNYSIQQTARESLYVVTTPDEKYKARAFTNMFVQRAAKGLSIFTIMGLVALQVRVEYLSLVTILVAIGMVLCSVYAGRRFADRSTVEEEIPQAA